MRFASLGSGSEGNSLIVSSVDDNKNTTVMLDCGFGINETELRLKRLGVDPSHISAIVITHEHQDHVGCVNKFALKYGLPVWTSYGTFTEICSDLNVNYNFCKDGKKFNIGNLELNPFTIPHDANEPLQFTFSNRGKKLGVLTDIGKKTLHVEEKLNFCNALIIEFNHDLEMLQKSIYPGWLKARIMGPYGHLSNNLAAELLNSINLSSLNKLVVAHVSLKNNNELKIRDAIKRTKIKKEVEIFFASQEFGLDWTEC
tara:strand:- start:136 stop:906 length:771 start_codon:yes stop_codon:yes gene_type:complete